VVSRGRNKGEARLQAALYIATVTELMIGRPALGGIAGGVEVVSERPRPIIDPSNRSRNLAGGFGEYAVFVPATRAIRQGPLDPEPPADPTVDLDPMPDVSAVDTDFVWYPPPTSLEE
jgi:hypothetical protein